eukprot:TRINITY_DN2375_c0_g1_i1.p1 TRINITY_DN2375_c0_g1~~TRINITY_DN2375_c0_g1_i1.p1  ORF type:complete len:427 (-),score=68.94 TRINITY_DN2375_c0_g1_i1:31-1311(-)
MASQYRLLIKNAKQLVTICSNGEKMKIGKQMDEVAIIENGAVVIDNNGNVVEVGSTAAIVQKYQSASFTNTIDATGKVVLPGLIDGHTHPVWSGDRVHEFAMKLAGATYMDIHKMGGGIGFTVSHTKQSSETELEELLIKRLWRMIKQGTTLIEAKSGYGLEAETELKMLKVLHKVQSKVPIDIVSNYLGGHSVPKGKSTAEATEDIINVQIPLVKKLNDAGEISATLIDVFCETGVFEVEDTRRILKAGLDHGLEINFHGDELTHIKASELAGELKALAISHVEKVSEEGIKALAIRPTVAVLLPTTAYILKLKPPPAKDLINNNVPVALGSDFNPNAHCVSMPFTMNLACVLMGMTMPQALNAATINAAASLNKSNTHGSLEAGKQGDMIILDAPTWEHLVYQLVDPPIQSVIKKGNVIFERKE